MPRDGTLKLLVDQTSGGAGGGDWGVGSPVTQPDITLSAAVKIADIDNVRGIKVAYARPGIALVVWSEWYGTPYATYGRAVRPRADGGFDLGPTVGLYSVNGYPLSSATYVQDGVVAVYQQGIRWVTVGDDLTVALAHTSSFLHPDGDTEVVLAGDGQGKVLAVGSSPAAGDMARISRWNGGSVNDGATTFFSPSNANWYILSFTNGGQTAIGYSGRGMASYDCSGDSPSLIVNDDNKWATIGYTNYVGAMMPGQSPGTVDLMVRYSGAMYLYRGISADLDLAGISPWWVQSASTHINYGVEGVWYWMDRVAADTYLLGYYRFGSLIVEVEYIDLDNDWDWSDVIADTGDSGYQGTHVGGGLFVTAFDQNYSTEVWIR